MKIYLKRFIIGKGVSKNIAPLIVLAFCFVVSAALGCFLVSKPGMNGSLALVTYLSHFALLFAEGTVVLPSFPLVALEFLIFPLLTFLLGFSSLGIFLIPLLFSLRIFLLSYTISAFFYVFGLSGLCLSFGVLGLHVFLCAPVLFSTGCAAYSVSARNLLCTVGVLTEKRMPGSYVLALIPICIVLLSAALLQYFAMPRMLFAVLNYL